MDVIIDKINTLEHRSVGWKQRKGYEADHGFVTENFAHQDLLKQKEILRLHNDRQDKILKINKWERFRQKRELV